MATKLRADAQRNRAAILRAAAAELAAHGELSMARVAESAGVSRSTLHRHFSGRSELEAVLRREALRQMRAALAAVGDDPGPAMAARRGAVGELLALGARLPLS